MGLEQLISTVTIAVLASFLGFALIGKIPPLLHTPLMSGSNAISGITLVGAVIIAGVAGNPVLNAIGFLAVVFGTMNVVGGYLVTDRMLRMFRKK